MYQFFNVFIEFLGQGVGAIFRFIAAVCSWAATQVGHMLTMPWQGWGMLRVLLLAALLGGVVWYLFYALAELWAAGRKVLTALAGMMAALIQTLPQILIAILIALAGIWVLSKLDFSEVSGPSFLHTGPSGGR